MLKDEDIICISSIDWDFIWQGHQEIMTRLARNGNRVLFIENTGVRAPRVKDLDRIIKRIANWRKGVYGIRKIEEGLYVYSPLVVPFPYLRIARFVNKRLISSILLRWLKTVGFSEPVVWAFLPTGLTLDLIERIDPKVLIYYCIDSFKASSKDARKIKRTEKILLARSDLVFVTSEELFKYCRHYNRNVHYFPFGVSVENFKSALRDLRETPNEIKRIRRPIAGYIGGVHRWIDFELVRYAAIKNKGVSFVFLGPVQTDVAKLKGLPNIIFLGQKKTEELPMYVKEFDVAIIPYLITEYTNNVYPTKLNEYLSLGKEVISTDLPEVRKFNDENNGIVRITRTADEFAEAVERSIRNPMGRDEAAFAMEVAEKNSWSNKIREMSLLIEKTEREKSEEKEAQWKKNLIWFYKKTKNRLVPLVWGLALFYAICFHTPLVWFLASPLQIKNEPKDADVIVALGGGVGESGKVGQGYQERVDTAVKLYNKGFAKNILYSSGYRYLMMETQVMKTLSLEMGVAEEDIVVDDNPVNTYEMIINLSELAKKKGWKKILLVSSPYHMLRLKLLCAKYLKTSIVLYVPVESCEYYSRGPRVKIRQIEGIAKEYLAILYYKLMNYI